MKPENIEKIIQFAPLPASLLRKLEDLQVHRASPLKRGLIALGRGLRFFGARVR